MQTSNRCYIQSQIGTETVVALAINPANDGGTHLGIGKRRLYDVAHQFVVLLGKDVERCLAAIAMANGNLARHDVGQSVDKNGRTWKELVGIAN